jgi:hypothetical protein
MSGDSYSTTFQFDIEGDSEVTGKLNQLAGKVQEVGTKSEESSKKTSSFTSALKGSALGLTAAASGAVGLYFQYDNLQKRSQTVEKQELAVSKANEEVSKSQAKLNALIAGGTTTGAEFQQVSLDLAQAQDKLKLKTQDLNIAQGDLTQSQLSFALGVVPTAINSVTTLSDVFGKLKAMKIANAAASGAEAMAEKGSMLSRWASIPSMFAATAATQGYGMAIKGAMIAMGPLGWALIGISTVMGLFATNAFGIRDAINAAGKAVGDAFPLFRPLLDGLSSLAKMIFPESGKASEDAASTISAASSTAATEGSASFDLLAANVDKSADEIIKDAARIENAMQKIGASPRGSSSSKETSSKYDFANMGGPWHNPNKTINDSSSVGSGGGTIVLKIEHDPDGIIKIIEKKNNMDVNVVFSSH